MFTQHIGWRRGNCQPLRPGAGRNSPLHGGCGRPDSSTDDGDEKMRALVPHTGWQTAFVTVASQAVVAQWTREVHTLLVRVVVETTRTRFDSVPSRHSPMV